MRTNPQPQPKFPTYSVHVGLFTHLERSPLKVEAPLNIKHIVVTLEVSHLERSQLKVEAPLNILLIVL